MSCERFAAAIALAIICGGPFSCKSGPATRDRQWTRCTCSYVSDFDEPGRTPIDVCTDGRGAEEVASSCVRNDGVGIPTSCLCAATSLGPCDKSDRCRPIASSR